MTPIRPAVEMRKEAETYRKKNLEACCSWIACKIDEVTHQGETSLYLDLESKEASGFAFVVEEVLLLFENAGYEVFRSESGRDLDITWGGERLKP